MGKVQNNYEVENGFSEEIQRLRYAGKLDEAIEKCKEAIATFPEDNFFYRILGDIYLQNNETQLAADAYFDNLKKLQSADLFKSFVRTYRRLQKNASAELILEFQLRIKNEIDAHTFPKEIEEELIAFFGGDLLSNNEVLDVLRLSDDDSNLHAVSQQVEKWEKDHNALYISLLVQHKLSNTQVSTPAIDKFLIEFLEKKGRYQNALDMIVKTQMPYNKKWVKWTVLRVCRRLSNYDVAESIYTIDESFISNADFNVLYELVYYFDGLHDSTNLDKTLKAMSSAATSSIPIARTLYNFYLSFNKFEEAQKLYESISEREERNKNNQKNRYEDRREEQLESEQVVWQRLKNLVSEQEHNRQMIAMRDLLKGFSHELGQPVTNIRYAVQLEKMKLDRGMNNQEDFAALLNTIIEQTDRIGRLLSRFRPIVSSKSTEMRFSVKECIESVFNDLRTRLDAHSITYTVGGAADLCVYGDPLQLSQVFYNLVLNSMQAIEKNGSIKVIISSDRGSKLSVSFSDTGPGIPKENYRKVFEPFFSTKDPTSGNGGEGLGLFIVWNILKMFNGTINIDRKFKKGARFFIKLPLARE